MTTNLFIGNLSYDATQEALSELFESEGYEVVRVNIVKDRETGRSRGFAFVELDKADSKAVIANLDGRSLMGRPIKVDAARERAAGGGAGRGGFRDRGGGGGGDRGGDRDRGGGGDRGDRRRRNYDD